jgi:hypothetical protein
LSGERKRQFFRVERFCVIGLLMVEPLWLTAAMPLRTTHLGGLRHPALLERASLSFTGIKTVRDPKAQGGERVFPELIDNASGVGSTLLAADLNKGGAADIATGNKLTTFIFWGKPHPAAAKD